jgi:hypothetical protein
VRLGDLLPRHRRTILGAMVVAAFLVPLVSTGSGAVQVCNNNNPITFTPPPQPTQAVLPLLPYPSEINVTGFTGSITDVNVILNGFTYPAPEDIDLLLVAPNGTSVLVMSDIGGPNDGVFRRVTNINLVFDDQAAANAPVDEQLGSGTFRPTDDDIDEMQFVPDNAEFFPAPAPAVGGSALTAFNGLDPNGVWRLYVVDDEPGPPEPGSFSGWCIDITTSVTGTTAPTTTGPTTTTTTTGPTTTTTTTAPTTTTTTTAPTTTTTTAPTTTTTAPTTTTTAAPTTTTTGPTTTTTVGPTTTTTTGPTTTTTTGPAPGTCDGLTPTIVGTSGNDNMFGTPGNDVIVGGGGNDSISGLRGNDVICGGAGNDRLIGGDGDDRLFGEAGSDQLFGGPGNDTLNGGLNADQCFGEAGTDTAAACETISGLP